MAQRVGMELAHIHPRPPAIRVFDAGMGDGSVLSRVMREMHRRFPTRPFYFVGKEISLEDVRLSLDKMPDRFYEHPATVMVVTNMYYTEAPWLAPKAVSAATSLVWQEVGLTGTTAHEFSEQIAALEPFLAKNWQARHSAKTGNPIYERPVALVIYRDDFRFMLDEAIPKQGKVRAGLRLGNRFAALPCSRAGRIQGKQVIGPLARALGPGGRLLGIHSCGRDPGLEIVRKIWPDENPFATGRHDLLRAVRANSARKRAISISIRIRMRARSSLRHAHAADRDRGQYRHLDSLRRMECRRLRGADRRRAPRARRRRTQVPRSHARRAANPRWSLFLDESYVVSRKRS